MYNDMCHHCTIMLNSVIALRVLCAPPILSFFFSNGSRFNRQIQCQEEIRTLIIIFSFSSFQSIFSPVERLCSSVCGLVCVSEQKEDEQRAGREEAMIMAYI